jgi:hypothetical protein
MHTALRDGVCSDTTAGSASTPHSNQRLVSLRTLAHASLHLSYLILKGFYLIHTRLPPRRRAGDLPARKHYPLLCCVEFVASARLHLYRRCVRPGVSVRTNTHTQRIGRICRICLSHVFRCSYSRPCSDHLRPCQPCRRCPRYPTCPSHSRPRHPGVNPCVGSRLDGDTARRIIE